ncbi:MAG: hypothetical protein IPO93_04275 [Actinobacteria bacterium]|nr:hypothetical protein [Actinomycetota bacterium]
MTIWEEPAEQTATVVPAPEADPFAVGQSAVAERVVRDNPGRFMYVPGIGWHAYDGRRWDQGNGAAEQQIRQAVVASARGMIADAAAITDRAERDEQMKLASRTLSSSAQVAGVVDFVQIHGGVLVRADQLNADPMLLNVTNGTLDLTTGRLLPHDHRDRITRVAGTEYRADAHSPRWEQFLAEALDDPALIAAVARCFGGAGLPGIVRDHLLPIIYGPGGAGKGTFYETVKAALGDYAIAAEPELLMASRNGSTHPTGSMDLLGVRLAFVSETDDGRRMAAATMKRLTGGDTIRARRMRQDFIEFRPSHLLALITNHLPTMPAGDDPAVWRRVRVVPFTRVPAKPDKRLGEHLKDDLAGVLAWLVAGHADYVERGDDVAWPESVESATAAYRGQSDVLGTFLAQATEPDENGAIPTGVLYVAWKEWLDGNAPDVKPGRTGDFVRKLRERGEQVAESGSKGARTVVKGRRLDDVSDVSDVSLALPLRNGSSSVHTHKTSETSETWESPHEFDFETSPSIARCQQDGCVSASGGGPYCHAHCDAEVMA